MTAVEDEVNMKIFSFLLAYLSLFTLSEANRFAARYDDFKVYRVHIKDEYDLSELEKLVRNFPLRILNDVRGSGRSCDVLINPADQNKLESMLSFMELNFECIIDDLQSVIAQEETLYIPSTSQGNSNEIQQMQMNWTHYQNLPVIYNWLDKLTADNPDLITPYVIGYSYENRPIKAVKISSKSGNKAIFIDSSIHAIEWISSAATTHFIENLVCALDEEMKFLLQNYDWIFVPILNPDGFVYSHDVNRLWRKNRKPTGFSNSSGECYGTDLNRNFNYHWGVNAYNYDVPCDHWYAGAKANSEPEVIALQNFINCFADGYISMYLSFHSYGNYVLLPYGHTTTNFPPNYDQMMRIATAFADGAKAKYGTKFDCGASGLLNYPVSGSAKDWVYGVKKVPFTATIELRDKGEYGFFLPRSQIPEVCQEVIDGLKSMIRQAEAEHLFD